MARAATGSLEGPCWTFICAGIGGFVALLIFLVTGALVSVDPPVTPEVTAPDFTPAQLFAGATDAAACSCINWDASNECCTTLKTSVDTGLTDELKTEFLTDPCLVPKGDAGLVMAQLGLYWQARCRKVAGQETTLAACVASAVAGGDNAATAQSDCEKAAAKAETNCAFLGVAKTPYLLTAQDNKDGEQCSALLGKNSVTQEEANRCASHPSMAWETLGFMTGGEQVTTQRCAAVTFAAAVQKGTEISGCSDGQGYNTQNMAEIDVADNSLCFGVTAGRQCSNEVLAALVAADDEKGDESGRDWDPVPVGAVAGNIAGMSNAISTTVNCDSGYVADGTTGEYFCSSTPYTDSAGYPIDKDGNILDDPSQAIGTWQGDLDCVRRTCAPACGSDLAPQVTGLAGATEQRPVNEGGADDTCCSGVYQDTCPIKCTRGYRVAVEEDGTPLDFTCGADGQWSGASCQPMQCYQSRETDPLAGGVSGVASGVVGYEYEFSAGCDAGEFHVGSHVCQTNLFFQGGGCVARPAATVTSPSVAVGGELADGAVVASSSNTGLAEKVWDNDPLTYWFSTRTTALSGDSPDWLMITLPSAIKPAAYSIQLGKSTDWESFLIKPKEWVLEGCDSYDDDANCVSWSNLHSQIDGGDDTANDNSPEAIAGGAGWWPPCNDVTLDPLNCVQADNEIPCNSDRCGSGTDCNAGAGCTLDACNFPTDDNPCGPSRFDIQPHDGYDHLASFTQFRIKFQREYTDTYRELDGTSTRYGQLYVQDIQLHELTSVNYNKDPAVGTTTHVMVPQDDAPCTDATSPVLIAEDGLTWRECMDRVTEEADGEEKCNGTPTNQDEGVCCLPGDCPEGQADECLPGCTTYTAFQFWEGLTQAGNKCVLIEAVSASPTQDAPNWPGTGSVCYVVTAP